MNDSEVTVLGAGIVGICCAIELQKSGYQVELIDRASPGSETSSGNAGVLSLGSIAPLASPALLRRLPGLIANNYADFQMHYAHFPQLLPWLLKFLLRCNRKNYFSDGVVIDALTVPSVEAHLSLIEQAGAEHLLLRNGGLRLYRQQVGFDRDALDRELLSRCHVEHELLDRDGIKDLEPDLNDCFVKATWVRQTVSITNPRELCVLYAKYFQRLGGVISQQMINAIKPLDKGWQYTTDQDSKQTAKLVLCLGAWTPELVKPLGYKNPLAIERGYHQMFARVPGKELHRPIFDVERNYVMLPMAEGIRITTGTNLVHHETSPTFRQLERVVPSARGTIPLGDALLDKPWMGRRPSTPDSIPVIGAAPRHADLWLAFGHAHMGLSMGPISGQIIASQITGKTPPVDATACAPERYL